MGWLRSGASVRAAWIDPIDLEEKSPLKLKASVVFQEEPAAAVV